MPRTFVDVHAIADNHRQNPIARWGVYAVASGDRLGTVTAGAAGKFRAETTMGEVSLHSDLRHARDAVAAAYCYPPEAAC